MLNLWQGLKSCMKPRLHLVPVVVLASVAVLGAQPAWADYHVEAGDVIEVWIGGPVDLSYRAAVQLDGTITIPRLGTISVKGLQPSEIKTKLQVALLGKPIRIRGGDGRTTSFMIAPDEVAAAVVEYRPIYVNGDVAKPGQYAFHPDMSVRQGIAVSGGYGALRSTYRNPKSEIADLRFERDTVSLQLAELEIRQTRKKAELTDKVELIFALPEDLRASQEALSALESAETELFKTRRDEFTRDTQYLERCLKESSDAINTLTVQIKKEDEGSQADVLETDNVLGQYKKGNTTNARISDLRRAVLASAGRKAQLNVQLFQAKQQDEAYRKQLDQLASQRKIAILAELQDDTVKQNELSHRLQDLHDKLAAKSTARTQYTPEASKPPSIVIFRNGQNGTERLSADEDFGLQPGDVVEVTGDTGNVDLALVR